MLQIYIVERPTVITLRCDKFLSASSFQRVASKACLKCRATAELSWLDCSSTADVEFNSVVNRTAAAENKTQK